MVRTRCGLTEKVLEKMAEAELDEKGCLGLGCFNRDQNNSGFDKVDASFFLNRPSRRWPEVLRPTRVSQAPRVTLVFPGSLPFLVRSKMAPAPAPSPQSHRWKGHNVGVLFTSR